MGVEAESFATDSKWVMLFLMELQNGGSFKMWNNRAVLQVIITLTIQVKCCCMQQKDWAILKLILSQNTAVKPEEEWLKIYLNEIFILVY